MGLALWSVFTYSPHRGVSLPSCDLPRIPDKEIEAKGVAWLAQDSATTK